MNASICWIAAAAGGGGAGGWKEARVGVDGDSGGEPSGGRRTLSGRWGSVGDCGVAVEFMRTGSGARSDCAAVEISEEADVEDGAEVEAEAGAEGPEPGAQKRWCFASDASVEKHWPQLEQRTCCRQSACIRLWRQRFENCVYAFAHTSHANGFTLLWMCMCCFRPEEVANAYTIHFTFDLFIAIENSV